MVSYEDIHETPLSVPSAWNPLREVAGTDDVDGSDDTDGEGKGRRFLRYSNSWTQDPSRKEDADGGHMSAMAKGKGKSLLISLLMLYVDKVPTARTSLQELG